VKFLPTDLAGAFFIELEEHHDERGFFARAWCADEFEVHRLRSTIVQMNVTYNAKRGTLRGLHYQAAPSEEAKVLRCTRGAIFDVIVDLRVGSPTYTQWLGVNLNATQRNMLYIPEGFAHGYQTLEDETELLYLMSNFHDPATARGIRFDDPAFAIEWPLPVLSISEKDARWDRFSPEAGVI
jgi:dTDP-4-dehydrorhamnose 3,5-epimerase